MLGSAITKLRSLLPLLNQKPGKITSVAETDARQSLLDYYNANRPNGPQPYICYAPFKSIYFETTGRAVACCANRTYSLGSYPKMSIRDIWFGKKADEFRELMRNNDLSKGCEGCREQISMGNFTGAMSTSFDRNKLNANSYPSLMQFELSNVCNLECEMCNGEYSSLIRAKREKLPPLKIAYDEGFVKQLEEFIPYLEETSFLGGEPFLIDIYYDIWQSIIRINPTVEIKVQTNGTVLNNRVKEILQQGDFHISISIDSLRKEVFEKIRKNARFDTVLSNIEYFNNYCKGKKNNLGIAVTPQRLNWKDLPELTRYANQLNAVIYFNNLISPPEMAIRNMTHVELEEVINYLLNQDLPSGTSIEKANKFKYQGLLNQIKGCYKQAGGAQSFSADLPSYYHAKDMRDFIETLSKQVRQNAGLNPEKISGKLLELEKQLSVPFAESRMAKMNLAADITALINRIETLPMEELVKMMQSPASKYSWYARNYKDFREHLIAQINKNGSLTEERKEQQINNITDKLQLLEAKMEVPFGESRMARLNLAEDLSQVINYIESTPVDLLVQTSR